MVRVCKDHPQCPARRQHHQPEDVRQDTLQDGFPVLQPRVGWQEPQGLELKPQGQDRIGHHSDHLQLSQQPQWRLVDCLIYFGLHHGILQKRQTEVIPQRAERLFHTLRPSPPQHGNYPIGPVTLPQRPFRVHTEVILI